MTTASELHFLRHVPGNSPVHRMWAGTKLLVVAGMGIAIVAQPSWPAQAVAAVVLAVALLACRVPLTAVPRIPKWFIFLIAFAGFLALTAGGKPEVHTPGFNIGFGGLIDWIRFTTLTVLVLGFATLAAYMKIGIAHAPNYGEPYVPTHLQPAPQRAPK